MRGSPAISFDQVRANAVRRNNSIWVSPINISIHTCEKIVIQAGIFSNETEKIPCFLCLPTTGLVNDYVSRSREKRSLEESDFQGTESLPFVPKSQNKRHFIILQLGF